MRVPEKFGVLDQGELRLVEYMGSDTAVVRAARVSTGHGSKGPESDQKLIRYLLTNQHDSPFEQCEISVRVEAPIFVERQWMRHRTAHVNSQSGRYSEYPSKYYLPNTSQIKKQSKNKQGRDSIFSESETIEVQKIIQEQSEDAFRSYDCLIKKGVSQELARLVLPMNLYSAWFWKCDLRNTLHFIQLRADSHAQWEIQQYAFVLATYVAILFPVVWHEWFLLRKSEWQDYFLYNIPSELRELIVEAWEELTEQYLKPLVASQ